MIRLVVDPGVLVSAAIAPSGAPAQLLSLILDGAADLVVSPTLIHELRDVLHRPKLRPYLTRHQATRFVALIQRVAIEMADNDNPPRVTRDPNDDYLVALAVRADAVAIVSGDRDLTAARGLDRVIVTPLQAIQRLTRGRS